MTFNRMVPQPRWPDLAWTIREAKIYFLVATACAGAFFIVAGIVGSLTGTYAFTAAITVIVGLAMLCAAIAPLMNASREPTLLADPGNAKSELRDLEVAIEKLLVDIKARQASPEPLSATNAQLLDEMTDVGRRLDKTKRRLRSRARERRAPAPSPPYFRANAGAASRASSTRSRDNSSSFCIASEAASPRRARIAATTAS